MKTRNFIPILLLFLAIASCGGEDFTPPHTPPDTTPTDSILEPDTTQQDTLPDVEPEDFARGADISWYTQMEDKGKKFYSWNHREPMECPSVMQDLGLNAIALRVLVTPSDGYCDIPDVLHKSLRVKQLDVDLLLSLHYSDTIASTSLQRTPVEWQEHDINMLVEDVQEHTSSVLQALTAENIHPRWIQIGNQLSQGLLWPEGDITRHAAQYARIVSAACSAARTACPQAQIIVAAGNPLHQPALCAALDGLRTTLYDQIGLTLYPTLSVGTIFQPIGVTASCTVQNEYDAIAYTMLTVDMLYNRYKKECMIVECGVPVNQETAGSMYMRHLVSEGRKNNTCRGIFYREPEAYEGWMGYTQGAFLSNGRPTQIIDALTK